MKISWIEPGVLAASGIPISEEDIRSLHQQGVRAILSLTEHPITEVRATPETLLHGLDMAYSHCAVPDQFPPSQDQAQDILRFIQDMQTQGRPVLVHCHAGIGRTGTILHLYYLAQGHSFDESRALIRQRRPQSTLLSEAQTQFLKQFAAKGSDSGQ